MHVYIVEKFAPIAEYVASDFGDSIAFTAIGPMPYWAYFDSRKKSRLNNHKGVGILNG